MDKHLSTFSFSRLPEGWLRFLVALIRVAKMITHACYRNMPLFGPDLQPLLESGHGREQFYSSEIIGVTGREQPQGIGIEFPQASIVRQVVLSHPTDDVICRESAITPCKIEKI